MNYYFIKDLLTKQNVNATDLYNGIISRVKKEFKRDTGLRVTELTLNIDDVFAKLNNISIRDDLKDFTIDGIKVHVRLTDLGWKTGGRTYFVMIERFAVRPYKFDFDHPEVN